jgi:hypothetical protein
MEKAIESVLSTGELPSRFEHRENFLVLDVRNTYEFEMVHLEWREYLHAIPVHYFEMLGFDGKDEMADSVIACIKQHLAYQLPGVKHIPRVREKRDTSKCIAGRLNSLGYPSANLKGGMKVWGKHYCTRTVVEDVDLAIHQVSRKVCGCLGYTVVSERKTLVIDPLRHIQPYLNLARSMRFNIERMIETCASRITSTADKKRFIRSNV